MKIVCSQCGVTFAALTGRVNRSKKRGGRLFCGLKCAGLARRVHRTDAEKKAIKADYDRRRRIERADELKAERAAYHKRTYDPVKAAIARKKRMPKHVEYCQRPEYKKWKREYDRQYRAQKDYGEFAECFLLTQDIRAACLERQSDYEIRLAAGTLNKSAKRKREYERAYSNQPEAGPMGDLG